MKISLEAPPAFIVARKYGAVYAAVAALEDGEYLRVETDDTDERKKINLALRRAAEARQREVTIKTDRANPLVMWATLKAIREVTDA